MPTRATSDFKDRIITILIYIATGTLYVSLAGSKLFGDIYINNLGSNNFLISILLHLVMLTTATGIFIVNLYSFSIFRRFSNILYTLISFLLIALVFIQLMIEISKDSSFVKMFNDSLGAPISQMLFILLLVLLSVEVFMHKQSIKVGLSLKKIILIFLLSLLGFILVYQITIGLSAFSWKSLKIVVFALSFLNFIAFILLFLIDGDHISRNIVCVTVIFASTYIFGETFFVENIFSRTLALAFRSYALIMLLKGFYSELLTSHIKEIDYLCEQNDDLNRDTIKSFKQRNKYLLDARKALDNEIDNAKKLQNALLLDSEITFPGCSFIFENYACERLSGDFYDVYSIDDDRVGMYILDVSGHGVGAALLNVYCYHYIRSTSPLIRRYMADNPHKILSNLYSEFNRLDFPDEMHIVIFIATYDYKIGKLTYSSGGLNSPPILVRNDGEIRQLDDAKGFPICKMGDYFTPEYNYVDIQLFKGDRILFYTDGLLDGGRDKIISKEDIFIILLESISEPLEVLKQRINDLIDIDNNKLEDDISYFILQVE